ncbi:hypothetical protein NKDENANG_02821 [Candidatus Entotheonellaceae bacterium PAL068K]
MRAAIRVGMAALLILFTQGVDARTVYVSRDRAALLDSHSVSGAVVGQVKRGQALQLIKKHRRWYFVATDRGLRGWIYRYKVNSNPPQTDANVFALLGASSNREAISESPSASVIRGLNPVSERQARRRGRSRQVIEAVKRMEQRRIVPATLERFLRQGRLAEFQEGL